MAESTVRLRKAAGGATLTYDGKPYTWKQDGTVVKVPYEFAMTLLGIPGGGYSVEGDEASEAAAAADPPADLSRRDASPITPKPVAGTVQPPPAEAPAEPAEAPDGDQEGEPGDEKKP